MVAMRMSFQIGCIFDMNFLRCGSLTRVFIGADCRSNRPTYSAANNGAVTTTDLITNCRTSSTAKATANSRIQSRICVRLNSRQCNC